MKNRDRFVECSILELGAATGCLSIYLTMMLHSYNTVLVTSDIEDGGEVEVRHREEALQQRERGVRRADDDDPRVVDDLGLGDELAREEEERRRRRRAGTTAAHAEPEGTATTSTAADKEDQGRCHAVDEHVHAALGEICAENRSYPR